MTVRRIQEDKGVVYYCTITCFGWLPLFASTNFYEEIYKWFGLLNAKNIMVVGYVIMPNHAHFLIHLPQSGSMLNKVIANGKRFMAYEIVSRLKKLNSVKLLSKLEEAVLANEKEKGKLHQVFTPSFDAKPCFTESFLKQKLEYIHKNPVSGKWRLINDYRYYPHSSAGFYELGSPSLCKIIHFRDL